MFRLLAYIASLFCLFFLSQEVFGAENFVGNRIGITGASSDVVIDARAIIDAGATVGPAIFDAQTNTLSGGMYIKGIGWAAFATGGYQVTMSDCPPLKHSCALNGTGWSDQIGEIDFSGVSYSRIAQKLQGSIRTHAGNFSLDGIDIAYGPASISSGSTLTAHHDTSVRLTNPSRYTGKILTLNLKHIDTHQSKRYTATGGVF